MSYKSWEDIKPQEGKQELAFSLLGKVDFMLWGGSRFGGKSELLSMIPLVFCDDPNYRGIFFRREYKEITASNGLWDKAKNMYPLFNAKMKKSEMAWEWPNGAKQQYSHMFQEDDKESHRGSGNTCIGFDEIDQFSQSQVTFLMTCLRSEAKVDSFMVGTLNPSPDSWCLPLVEYYLDENGFPDQNKVGHIRHFIVKDNEIIFGDSEEYFQENYRECLYVTTPEGKEVYVRPKTFTFIFFNIFDNPLGIAANPSYLSELNNLPDHERNTQLYGNWYSKPKGESLWKREWVRGEEGEKVKRIDEIPEGCQSYRGWDKGYHEKVKGKHNDPTACSPQILKDPQGFYWLLGNYAPSTLDREELDKKENLKVYGRFRELAGARDKKIIAQAKHDGQDCFVVLAKDAGAGMTDHKFTLTQFIEEGVRYIESHTPHNTPDKKLRDFQPFCQACSSGLVYIVEDTFPPETLKKYYSELENFDPKIRSNSSIRDDWVDSTSLAFNEAVVKKVYKTPKITNLSKYKTLSSEFLTSRGL